MNRIRIASCLLLLACSMGCNSQQTSTVKGTAYVDGQPTGGLEISFRSDEDGSVAMGGSQKDGRYELFIGRGRRDIVPGKYHVTVTPTSLIADVSLPDVKLPAKYADYETTDLILTVEPGENELDLQIETQ